MKFGIGTLFSFLFGLAIIGCHGVHGDVFSEKYPFSLTLQEGIYDLYWNFSTVDETIHFAVKVNTTGWVGFGISPNGQMPGSDVIIAWVDGDEAYFHDRYAERRSLPTIDPMQDWFLISAAIHDGYTEFEFSRNFTTCDNESRDLDILAETSRIVYSWNNNKPTVSGRGDSETYSIEIHQMKGSTSVNLLGGLPSGPQIPANTPQFTVQVNNVQIPNKDTTYWCRGMRFSSLIEDIKQTKQYIVKFEAALSESSKEYVHHILVYTCNGLTEEDIIGQGGDCDQQSRRINNCRSTGGLLIAAWAVGGSAFVYPENVAYPVGGPDDHTDVVIEMHYNNPNEDTGVIDSSGISFFYIDTPREHDAGILILGHRVTGNMMIPPGSSNYTTSGFCYLNCTNQFLPQDGIKVFANVLHTHLAGIGLSFSVLQNGGLGKFEEVKVIERNLKYDFNFQQVNHLAEEITVLPGDIFLLNCYYRTIGRNYITLGGESTKDEMCLTFPFYYPRIEMNGCLSQPLLDRFEQFLDEYVPLSGLEAFENVTDNSEPSEIADALNTLEWTEEQINGFEENIYLSGNQYHFCFSDDKFIQDTGKVPVISQYYSPPRPVRNCSLIESEPDGATVTYVKMILLLIMIILTFIILI